MRSRHSTHRSGAARIATTVAIVCTALVLLAPSATAATTNVTGTVGTVTDAGSSAGQFYLRNVGDPAPAGFSHQYQWGSPAALTNSPEDGAITIAGELDLTARTTSTALVGLLDASALANGSTSFQRGAYIYVNSRSDGTVRIGLSDGNAAGELVQTSVILSAATADAGPIAVSLTIDGTADPAGCAVGTAADADGCMTLQINALPPLTDSYGSVVDAAGDTIEFAGGGYFGWDVTPGGGANIGYDLDVPTVDVAPVDPTTKDECKKGGWADFGFSNQGQCIRFVNTGKDSRV